MKKYKNYSVDVNRSSFFLYSRAGILVAILLCNGTYESNSQNVFHEKNKNKKKPHIIMLLADDLGYGDLSLPPFNTNGIKTPEIEAMAKEGLIMTK